MKIYVRHTILYCTYRTLLGIAFAGELMQQPAAQLSVTSTDIPVPPMTTTILPTIAPAAPQAAVLQQQRLVATQAAQTAATPTPLQQLPAPQQTSPALPLPAQNLPAQGAPDAQQKVQAASIRPNPRGPYKITPQRAAPQIAAIPQPVSQSIQITNTTPITVNVRFETPAGITAIEPIAGSSSRTIVRKVGTPALYAFEGASTIPITTDMVKNGELVIQMPTPPTGPTLATSSENKVQPPRAATATKKAEPQATGTEAKPIDTGNKLAPVVTKS